MTNIDRSEKRERFEQAAKKRSMFLPLVLLAAVCLAAIVGGVFLMRGDLGTAKEEQAAVPAPAASVVAGPDVRVPVSELAGGEAKFVDYQAPSGGKVRLFALKGTDGEYRAALDACEVCYHGKKGYAQQGDKMVCRQCGNAYAPALIDKAPGGCHPVGLPRKVEGNELVVKGSDIEAAEKKLQESAKPVRVGS